MITPWLVLIMEGFTFSLFSNNIVENDSSFCMVVIMINIVVLIGTIINQGRNCHATLMLLGGLLFRVILLTWDLNYSYIYQLPNSGQDTESFAIWAKNGFLTGDYMRGGVYARFISFWYSFFGIQRPIAQYINVLLAMTAIMLVVRIMDYLEIDYYIQNTAIALLSFLPNFAITNSILLRETLIICILTISVYSFVRWIYEGGTWKLIKSVVFVCLAATVHSGAIAVLLGEAMVFVLYDRQKQSMRFSYRSIIGLGVVVIGFILLYTRFSTMLFSKFQGINSAADIISTADRYNVGSSSYDAGFTINNNKLSLIINTPIRMFYFVASPLPWNWRGVADIIAFCFSSTVFIYAYLRAYSEIKHTKNIERKMLITVMVLLALSGALIFAWGVSNAGTALRHREKFLTIHVLLIALCNDNRLRRRYSSMEWVGG